MDEQQGSPVPSRSRLKSALGWLIAGAILSILGHRLYHDWQVLDVTSLRIGPLWLVLSLLVFWGYCCLLVQPWRGFLRQLGTPLPYRQAFVVFRLAKLGRYLPGKVGLLLGQMYFCSQVGIPRTQALSACLQELVGLLLSGCLVIACTLAWTSQVWPPVFARLLHVAAIVLSATLILMLCFRRWFLPRFRQLLPEGLHLTPRRMMWCLFQYVLLWGAMGFAFWLLVRSVTPLDWHDLPSLTGQYALAWVTGFLSFLTPSGLGVREGALAYLLSRHLPPATATLVALLARVWFLVGELTLVLGIGIVRWFAPQLDPTSLNRQQLVSVQDNSPTATPSSNQTDV